MTKLRAMIGVGLLASAGAVAFSVPVTPVGSADATSAATATGPAASPATIAAAGSATIPAAGQAAIPAAPTVSAGSVPGGRSVPGGGSAPPPEPSDREPAVESYTGSASYYADLFEGRTTASGVAFRQSRLWAAHQTLPFGTRLRVTNLANGRQVEVEVVDRGPYAHGRILDLSRTAARRLDFIRAGHTRVRVEVLP